VGNATISQGAVHTSTREGIYRVTDEQDEQIDNHLASPTLRYSAVLVLRMLGRWRHGRGSVPVRSDAERTQTGLRRSDRHAMTGGAGQMRYPWQPKRSPRPPSPNQVRPYTTGQRVGSGVISSVPTQHRCACPLDPLYGATFRCDCGKIRVSTLYGWIEERRAARR
jgi:hypothetical protein